MAGGLHNPAPGNARYEAGAKPGSPGTQAGQPKHEAIGAHTPNKQPIVTPDSSATVKNDMTSLMGKSGGFHGPKAGGGTVSLNVDQGAPYGTHNKDAGRGNP